MDTHYTSGIRVKTPDGNLVSKSMLLVATADLPAKACMLNMKQYNGKYGCSACEMEGVSRQNNHLHRDWPYKDSVALRTHLSLMENARAAVEKDDVASVMHCNLSLIDENYVSIM